MDANVNLNFDWRRFRYDVCTDVRDCALYMFFFYAVYLLATFIITFVGMFASPAASEMLAGMMESMTLNPDSSSSIDLQGVTDGLAGQSNNLLGLTSMVAIVAGSMVFLIPRKRRFFTDIMLPAAERMTPKIFIVLIVVIQCIQLLTGLLSSMIDYLLPEELSIQDTYASAMEVMASPLGAIYVVLVGPIFEELIFRGAIMGSLRRYGENFAIIFSSLFFAFYHMMFLQIPFAFLIGLIFGYVATRWSLRAAIVLHIFNNGLSTLITSTDNENVQIINVLVMIACSIATLIMAVKWREQFQYRVKAGAAYYAHTYANGFSSIAFWIFVLIMTGFGFLQMYLPVLTQSL